MLDVVKRNALVRGGLKVGDELIDLQRIRSPLLNVVAEFDSVVRPSSSLRLLDMVGSKDKNNLVFPMGHIGIALSDKAHAKLWPQIGRWLQERDN
jgi:polyhydroxyalkanoate synthase